MSVAFLTHYTLSGSPVSISASASLPHLHHTSPYKGLHDGTDPIACCVAARLSSVVSWQPSWPVILGFCTPAKSASCEQCQGQESPRRTCGHVREGCSTPLPLPPSTLSSLLLHSFLPSPPFSPLPPSPLSSPSYQGRNLVSH